MVMVVSPWFVLALTCRASSLSPDFVDREIEWVGVVGGGGIH